MELLERKYIRELAKQHDLRINEAISNNTIPQLMLDLDDELKDLTKELSEDDAEKFEQFYSEEMNALSSILELETSKKLLEVAQIEAKTAEVELNQAQEENEIKIIGYVVAFAIIFFVGLFIFGK